MAPIAIKNGVAHDGLCPEIISSMKIRVNSGVINEMNAARSAKMKVSLNASPAPWMFFLR